MSQKARIKQAGFTLVEMTIVIALVALSATFVVPSLARWRAAEETRAFRGELLRLLGRGREEAVLARADHEMRLSAEDRSFILSAPEAESEEVVPIGRTRIPSQIDVGLARIADDEVAPADWVVTFHADGSCETAGLEVHEGASQWSATIDEGCRVRVSDGPLAEPQSEHWYAGEHEQRQ